MLLWLLTGRLHLPRREERKRRKKDHESREQTQGKERVRDKDFGYRRGGVKVERRGRTSRRERKREREAKKKERKSRKMKRKKKG